MVPFNEQHHFTFSGHVAQTFLIYQSLIGTSSGSRTMPTINQKEHVGLPTSHRKKQERAALQRLDDHKKRPPDRPKLHSIACVPANCSTTPDATAVSVLLHTQSVLLQTLQFGDIFLFTTRVAPRKSRCTIILGSKHRDAAVRFDQNPSREQICCMQIVVYHHPWLKTSRCRSSVRPESLT